MQEQTQTRKKINEKGKVLPLIHRFVVVIIGDQTIIEVSRRSIGLPLSLLLFSLYLRVMVKRGCDTTNGEKSRASTVRMPFLKIYDVITCAAL